jgi:hypothetical protein
MDLELNSEGGSGGPTSACSDQLFDACGAEPALDLPHGGVVGGRSLALARSRSSASVSGPAKGSSRGAQAPLGVIAPVNDAAGGNPRCPTGVRHRSKENLAASRYTEIPAAARRKGVLAAMAQQQIEAKLN